MIKREQSPREGVPQYSYQAKGRNIVAIVILVKHGKLAKPNHHHLGRTGCAGEKIKHNIFYTGVMCSAILKVLDINGVSVHMAVARLCCKEIADGRKKGVAGRY